IRDLNRRGRLDRTIAGWGAEFRPPPTGELRDSIGRTHHIDAYSMWLAGGGIRPGITIGETDEFGFGPVEDRVHVHDVQATLLHCIGLDHRRLTFRFQGRDYRLTDVHGNVVEKMLA